MPGGITDGSEDVYHLQKGLYMLLLSTQSSVHRNRFACFIPFFNNAVYFTVQRPLHRRLMYGRHYMSICIEFARFAAGLQETSKKI